MAKRSEARREAFKALRSQAREAAFQVLYQDDLNAGVSPSVGDAFLRERFGLPALLDGEDAAVTRVPLVRLVEEELLAQVGSQREPAPPAGDDDWGAQFRRSPFVAPPPAAAMAEADDDEEAEEPPPPGTADGWPLRVQAALREFVEREGRRFASELIGGTRRSRPDLDRQIARAAEHWDLHRMAATDRNVIRLGAYEMLYTDTPPRVAIDEAVELARRFGSADSASFVNGILDRLLKNQPGGRGAS